MTDFSYPSFPRVILFDWGNTLMREIPEFSGPMVEWPRVEVVPGAREALESLYSRCVLAVATNARASSASQALAAFHRAGLDRFFASVLTSHDVGITKPDPTYFRSVLAALGYEPGEVLMVGDNYALDIKGARDSGLRAIWYNPQLESAPSLFPEQNGEISWMGDLPRLLETLHLPDIQTCRNWQVVEEMPLNIMDHSNVVAAVAYDLAMRLLKAGHPVDPILAHRGGLLHDLDKYKTLRQGNRHGRMSYELLMQYGQPELAEIALRHNLPAILDPLNGLQTWEQKLVFYADKLVEGNRLVPLSKRFQALKTRYPSFAGQIERCAPLVYDLESGICRYLMITPEGLLSEISPLIEKYY